MDIGNEVRVIEVEPIEETTPAKIDVVEATTPEDLPDRR